MPDPHPTNPIHPIRPRLANVLRYRTEIVVPSDRYVCLQLPDHLPEGRAVVTVHFLEPGPTSGDEPYEGHDDRLDIEWWEEFDVTPDPLE
jgi:hypothetical protein